MPGGATGAAVAASGSSLIIVAPSDVGYIGT